MSDVIFDRQGRVKTLPCLFSMVVGDKNKREQSAVDDDPSPFDQPVVVPLTDVIDLHPFQPKEIPSLIEEYIDQCAQAGLRHLRIIHGKGIGVQRNIIRAALTRHAAVLSYEDAPPEAGGWGATLVTLKTDH